MNFMKIKSDFVVVKFNENEPHTAQEWWIYWVNRYHPTAKEKTALCDFMKDKYKRNLVSDAYL
jgi:hypothetical protein